MTDDFVWLVMHEFTTRDGEDGLDVEAAYRTIDGAENEVARLNAEPKIPNLTFSSYYVQQIRLEP